MFHNSSFNIPNSLPRAYREKKTNFYGYGFIVNKHTLIPRPETEQLVERTVALVRKHRQKQLRILDVGTGSGVIAITLKKLLPRTTVEATDISAEALEIATANAKNNRVSIAFHHGSLFEPVGGRFDLIVANLPYVPASRWRFLDNQVRDYEPKDAIVAGRDGLKWIRQFCQLISAYIMEGGVVALEIDDNHGSRVQKLLQQALPDHKVTIEPDLAHKNRFAFAVPFKLDN